MPSQAPEEPTTDTSETTGSNAAPSSHARELIVRAIASELQAARKRAGLSVAELHRRTGISRTVLQGYEAGKFAPGTVELKKVCEVLGVTPNRIVFGDEKPLQAKPLLETLVGDLSVATNAFRLSTIFQVLTTQERTAIFSLIESIASPRLGGTEQLNKAMGVFDILLSEAAFSPEKLREFAEGVVESIPESTFEKLQAIDEQTDHKASKKADKTEK